MDSDEGEGESINEARWREGGRFICSKNSGEAQHVSSLLSARAFWKGGR